MSGVTVFVFQTKANETTRKRNSTRSPKKNKGLLRPRRTWKEGRGKWKMENGIIALVVLAVVGVAVDNLHATAPSACH